MFPPPRPWPDDFPPVAIHADESRVKQHPAYPGAKSGDADAALQLVQDTLALPAVESLRKLLCTACPILVSAHALEQVGVNASPETLADFRGTGWHAGQPARSDRESRWPGDRGHNVDGKPHSASLAPTAAQLTLLRNKHGKDLETWWLARFGHGFDCLTQSEARYLERTANADTIRDRIAAAEQTGNRPAGADAPPRQVSNQAPWRGRRRRAGAPR